MLVYRGSVHIYIDIYIIYFYTYILYIEKNVTKTSGNIIRVKPTHPIIIVYRRKRRILYIIKHGHGLDNTR